jgi:DNA-binding Xre family transcriptional regulator
MFFMDPETERLISLLRVSFKVLGVSNREAARRMGMSPSYVSKLLSGATELRLDHLVRMCRAADVEPAEFFSLAYPGGPAGGPTPAMTKLRDLLQSGQPPPARVPEPFTEEQLEQMLKVTLAKLMGGRSNGA